MVLLPPPEHITQNFCRECPGSTEIQEEETLREIGFVAPTSLDQAVGLLATAGGDGRLLAGGTDLIIQMRAGVRQPATVIDAKRIPELQVLSFDARSGLRLGAALACCRVIEDETLQTHYPGLVDAAALIRLRA